LVSNRCGNELELIKQPLFNNILLLNEVIEEEFPDVQYVDADEILNLQVDCEKYFVSLLDAEGVLNPELINYTNLVNRPVFTTLEASIPENENSQDTTSNSLADLVINAASIYFIPMHTYSFLPLYVGFDNTEGCGLINSLEDSADFRYSDSITCILTHLVEHKFGVGTDNTDKSQPSALTLPFISYELGSNFSEILETLETTISIDSQILPDSDLPLGYPRLLSTDQVLVIPTDTTIRFLVTSNDVIHS